MSNKLFYELFVLQHLVLVSPSSSLVLLLLDVGLFSVDVVGALLVGCLGELFVGRTGRILVGGTSELLVGRIYELRIGGTGVPLVSLGLLCRS